MTKLQQIAKTCDDIAAANGFDPPTWENLPVKLALVITELDEARDGVHGIADDPLEEELADIAIRLLSILHSGWGDDWGDRITRRKITEGSGRMFEPIEVLLWPVLGHVTKAIEHWRFNNDKDTRMHIELALLKLWRLADNLWVDLDKQILLKCEKNRKREHLHGKANAAG